MRWMIIAGTLAAASVATAQKSPSAEKTFLWLLENESSVLSTSADERVDIRDLVDRYMLIKLRRTLDLSDEQVVHLFEDIGQYKDRLSELKWDKGAARERLRDRLDSDFEDAEVRKQLDALLSKEMAIAEGIRTVITEARKDIPASEAARLYLFLDSFEAEIKRLIHHALVLTSRGIDVDDLRHRTRSGPDAPAPSEQARDEAFDRMLQSEVRALSPGEQDAEMRDLVQTLMMLQLAKVLELSPEKTVLVLQRVSQFKDQLYAMKVQIGRERGKLGDLLETGAPGRVIDDKVEDLLLQEEAIAELIRVLITEAEQDIGLEKSARLYLFVGDFEDRIRRMLYKAQQAAAAHADLP